MMFIYHTRKKVIVIENKVEEIKEENEIISYETTDIKNLIYTIRGKQVMLDRDLAELYNCKNGTKTP